MASEAMRAGGERDSQAAGEVTGRVTDRGDLQPMRFPRALRIGFWVCLVIAVAVVLRRAALLSGSSVGGAPQLAGLDRSFAAHAALTWLHILSALALVLLLPFLFWQKTRDSRLLQRAFFLLGAVVGGTAYAMNIFAVGGWLERSAVVFFDTLFLISMVRAGRYALRGDGVGQQIWSVRAIAVLLGIATTRPVMGVFFATSRLTGLTPPQFFGIAFWIGFSINAVLIEFWLGKRGLRAERRLI